MPKYNAKVIVRLKDEVKDTQGLAVDKILSRLNVESSANFRAGKFFSFNLNCKDYAIAQEKLQFVCQEVISNPVVEIYEILSFKEVL